MPKLPELSVVVPCYNEQDVICECHRRLTEAIRPHVSSFEIVYVNDGSSDNTLSLLLGLYSSNPEVRIVNFSRNFGHQLAVSAGLEYAEGEAVVIIDADLQDPPEVLVQMLQKYREGYDVVYGVRRTRSGESLFKLQTAKFFYRFINLLSDTPIPLDTGDFRLMSRRAVAALTSMRESHRLLRGMASWIGFRQFGLEYERAPRFAGTTKYPFRKMLSLAIDGVLSFSTLPLRLFTFAGIAAAVFALLGIFYALALRLFTNIWVRGWTLLFIGMLFLGGLQLISLGIVGEYVGSIYTETKRRPLFLVQEFFGAKNAGKPGSESMLTVKQWRE